MITNNAKKIFNIYSSGYSAKLTNLAGNEATAQAGNSYGAIQSLTGYNAQNFYSYTTPCTWLDVGFGDTPESAADYCLADSNYVAQKLTVTACGKNTAQLGDFVNIYINFRNDTNENVIVKEIGICGNPTTGQNIANVSLYFRKVLDTPITMAPGEQYSFTYNVRFKN